MPCGDRPASAARVKPPARTEAPTTRKETVAVAPRPDYRPTHSQRAPFVYRLGRQPFTLKRRVRFPQGAPEITARVGDRRSRFRAANTTPLRQAGRGPHQNLEQPLRDPAPEPAIDRAPGLKAHRQGPPPVRRCQAVATNSRRAGVASGTSRRVRSVQKTGHLVRAWTQAWGKRIRPCRGLAEAPVCFNRGRCRRSFEQIAEAAPRPSASGSHSDASGFANRSGNP